MNHQFEVEVTFALYPQSKLYHAFIVVTNHSGYNKGHGQSNRSFFQALRHAMMSCIFMLMPGMTTEDLEQWADFYYGEAQSLVDLPYYDDREAQDLEGTAEMLLEEVNKRRAIA